MLLAGKYDIIRAGNGEKRMTKSEIETAIDEQAAEIALDLGMKRDAFHDLPCVKKFATIVTGVRRCGKSTLLGQWAHDSGMRVVSVLFDDLRLMNFTSADFVLLGKIISERKPQAVALDEIQDIDGWELFVNGLLNRGYAVFVTGSNARMLSRELGTKLTGRHLDLELHPFSYPEFIRFREFAHRRIPGVCLKRQQTSARRVVQRHHLPRHCRALQSCQHRPNKATGWISPCAHRHAHVSQSSEGRHTRAVCEDGLGIF